MAPFEALYERKCISPVCWFEDKGNKEFEPNYMKDQQVVINIIRDRLKIAQSRQKELCRLEKKNVGTPSRRYGIFKSQSD
jgi:hypothetical protein